MLINDLKQISSNSGAIPRHVIVFILTAYLQGLVHTSII